MGRRQLGVASLEPGTCTDEAGILGADLLNGHHLAINVESIAGRDRMRREGSNQVAGYRFGQPHVLSARQYCPGTIDGRAERKARIGSGEFANRQRRGFPHTPGFDPDVAVSHCQNPAAWHAHCRQHGRVGDGYRVGALTNDKTHSAMLSPESPGRSERGLGVWFDMNGLCDG